MSTQWWREPWRKLYLKLDAKWLGLSVSARGLGDELIKYADADGRLFRVEGQAAAGKEIARRLSARPGEYRRIGEDTKELLDDTYIVIADGWLFIRNFIDAQERLSPDARRQRAKRERDKQRDDDRDVSRDGGVTVGVTGARDSHRDPIRSDPNRVEDSPPARMRVMDWRALQDAWTFGTGNIGANGLHDAGLRCEEHAALIEMPPNDYAEKAIRLFCQWVDGCPPSKRPPKSPVKFVEHFERVHEMVIGARKPVEVETPRADDRSDNTPRPRALRPGERLPYADEEG